MNPDPIAQFRRWFDEAASAELPLPNAMTLATATPEGKPSARVVLLKGVDERGLVFFTNYRSRKGRELASNPLAAAVLYWEELHRQVRIEGSVEALGPGESDAYFRSRPRGARLGAWASPQSSVIASRGLLERRVKELKGRFHGRSIPRPRHWGGYRLRPASIEFWEGRANRLHDRLLYVRRRDGSWRVQRLAP